MPRTRTHRRGETRAMSSQFALDVAYYLMQDPRQLPSRYLYDSLGSALFDAITLLPWYPLTRAESRLLVRHGAEILGQDPLVSTIVELGPGGADKLSLLLESAGAAGPLEVHLVDVSGSTLAQATHRLDAFPNVRVHTHEVTYEAGLQQFAGRRGRTGHTLAMFLGSNIGNFDAPGCDAFLRTLRGALRAPGDALLLGVDLIKPEDELLRAYDDPLGVTAAFNRNLLVRINRELDAAIDVDGFAHRAIWNGPAQRVEMHLVSVTRQRVRVPDAQVDFWMEAGESIWTESSYKYEPDQIMEMLERAGFAVVNQWINPADRFALTLGVAS